MQDFSKYRSRYGIQYLLLSGYKIDKIAIEFVRRLTVELLDLLIEHGFCKKCITESFVISLPYRDLDVIRKIAAMLRGPRLNNLINSCIERRIHSIVFENIDRVQNICCIHPDADMYASSTNLKRAIAIDRDMSIVQQSNYSSKMMLFSLLHENYDAYRYYYALNPIDAKKIFKVGTIRIVPASIPIDVIKQMPPRVIARYQNEIYETERFDMITEIIDKIPDYELYRSNRLFPELYLLIRTTKKPDYSDSFCIFETCGDDVLDHLIADPVIVKFMDANYMDLLVTCQTYRQPKCVTYIINKYIEKMFDQSLTGNIGTIRAVINAFVNNGYSHNFIMQKSDYNGECISAMVNFIDGDMIPRDRIPNIRSEMDEQTLEIFDRKVRIRGNRKWINQLLAMFVLFTDGYLRFRDPSGPIYRMFLIAEKMPLPYQSMIAHAYGLLPYNASLVLTSSDFIYELVHV